MTQFPKMIGDELWTAVGFSPQVKAAGTIEGTAMLRMGQESEQGFDSCVLHCSTGTTGATGTPDSFSVVYTVEESADGSTGWTAISGATATITAINSEAQIKVNLVPVNPYVRAKAVATFVNGTTPTVIVGGVFTFGGARKIPVVSLSA